MIQYAEIVCVSTSEMAAMLGVRRGSVRRWASRGLIPKVVLPSGRFVFEPQAVIAKLREIQTQGGRHV